ncbi:hypothetical protein [uncultured Psychrobacillus sp.]|uniref:hypothetical protein n=1 Tax=uncultured Psychrobacillus sp. TaxID=1551585 RepID=UPI0026232E3D|nr:hypothetical protein [uncultured Psychrobacillus sp.]
MVKRTKKKSKKKSQRLTAPPKKLEQVSRKKKLLLSVLYVGLILMIIRIVWFIRKSIDLGIGVEIFLLVSIVILIIVIILIIHLEKKYPNYSHPFWVIFLGLVVTFVGFTLSGYFQEVVKKPEEKIKLQHSLYILIEESEAQKRGLERTILDFRTLFEEDNDEKKQFYVRKQISVYNESDMKNSVASDFRFVARKLNKGHFTYINIADMGSVSEIYNSLTFKSNDPEEMLQSYSELISLYYQVNERRSVLSAEYNYLEDASSSDYKKDLKKSRKKNKDEALKLIDDFEDLISRKYPKVTLKVDKKSLLE